MKTFHRKIEQYLVSAGKNAFNNYQKRNLILLNFSLLLRMSQNFVDNSQSESAKFKWVVLADQIFIIIYEHDKTSIGMIYFNKSSATRFIFKKFLATRFQ